MWIIDKIFKSDCNKLQRRKSSKNCIERRIWQILDMSIAEEHLYFRCPHP